jgi:hypothetical protein
MKNIHKSLELTLLVIPFSFHFLDLLQVNECIFFLGGTQAC